MQTYTFYHIILSFYLRDKKQEKIDSNTVHGTYNRQ